MEKLLSIKVLNLRNYEEQKLVKLDHVDGAKKKDRLLEIPSRGQKV